jgi:hypothetical protein
MYRGQKNCFGYIKAIGYGVGKVYTISWFDGFRDTKVGQFALEKVDIKGD